MSEKMIAIPEGNLLRVAKIKNLKTLVAVEEKTRIDRKTLMAINAGRPVEQTILQSIADKIKVPIAHLFKSDQIDIYTCHYRDLKLQQLDGDALREIAGKTDYITWVLNANVSKDLEAILFQLSTSLRGWFKKVSVKGDPSQQDDLDMTTSAGIDEGVKEFARHKLKIFGATYVGWRTMHSLQGNVPVQTLEYRSRRRAVLSIVAENKTNPIVRVSIGVEPPKKFVAGELVGIDRVDIDGTQVWPRKIKHSRK